MSILLGGGIMDKISLLEVWVDLATGERNYSINREDLKYGLDVEDGSIDTIKELVEEICSYL